MTRTGSADLSGLTLDRDAPPTGGAKVRWPRIVALLGAVFAIVAVVALKAVMPKTIDVKVALAEAIGGTPGASASQVLTASGYVVARQRASVSTEVTGRLESLLVGEGSRVVKGEILGVLRNQDQLAAMESAKAALAAAQASSVESKATARESALELNRARELLGRGLVSQAEFDAAEARDAVSRARVQSAAAAIESATALQTAAGIAYEKTFIRAPFAGAVLRKEAEVGEIVSPIPGSGGLTRGAIVTMANLATLEVEVDVNEGYVSRTRENMRAEIMLDAYPNELYPGRVRQIVPTADRQKATVQVKVVFDSLDTRVLPEMGAKVTFLSEPEPEALGGAGAGGVSFPVSIPRAAVRERDGEAVIFVVQGNRAMMRSVSPRPLGTDRMSVSRGLAPGERVVVEAPVTLADRARVRVK